MESPTNSLENSEAVVLRRATAAEYGGCSPTCALFVTNGPLWSAQADPDSTATHVEIATLTLAGAPGDSVALVFEADSQALSVLSPDERVLVTAGSVVDSLPLRTLATPAVVFMFVSSDTVTIQYNLNRRMMEAPVGHVSLTQLTSARVLSEHRQWIAAGTVQGSSLLSTVSDPCASQTAVNAPGSVCGVTVQFAPYAAADAFLGAGAKFQSDPGHGVSRPITIAFSAPVSSVTVTVYDPTFGGNQMEAFNAGSCSLGVAGFPGNFRPGVLTTQTKTLSGQIASIVLTPGYRDYVAYSMVVVIGSSSSLSVVSAVGPNDFGSFTILSGESLVTLSAAVTPATLTPRVRWIVVDDSLDLLETVGPLSVPDGAASSFVVPVTQERSRYREYAHPGVLAQKSLALRVRARVTDDNGQAVTSDNERVVRQDEIDTIREEYIELRVRQGVPGREDFGPPDVSHPNRADYSRVLRIPAFDARFAELVAAWTERPLLGTITGGYRNPVHNWRHISVRSGSGPVGSSWHMYGCAIDMQTYPILNQASPPRDTLAARAYWDRLSAKALRLSFLVEPRDRDPNHPTRAFSGVGHVHVNTRCR